MRMQRVGYQSKKDGEDICVYVEGTTMPLSLAIEIYKIRNEDELIQKMSELDILSTIEIERDEIQQ